MRIRVDTDALLEVARRYEQVSLELADTTEELNQALNVLTSAMPGQNYILEQIGGLIRKSNLLNDEIDNTRVDIRYAARLYEETDKQLKRQSHEFALNFNTSRQED